MPLVARTSTLFVFCFLAAVGLAHADEGMASLVRLRVIGKDGATQLGTGVLIAPELIATACHVTRNAGSIEVFHGSNRWVAHNQEGNPLHDLCVIHASVRDVPIARIRGSRTLRQGERVLAAGFEGGRTDIAVSAGTVAGLYSYHDGFVIRTSAAFDFGSSGGGLFDEAGNLVGLLAFKARTGNNLRFALPSEWLSPSSMVAAAFCHIEPVSSAKAFWERPQADRPAFLGVAMHDAASERS